MMKGKSGQVWIHVISCIIFLALPFFFSPDGPDNPRAFFSNPESHREILRYSLLTIFFYLNYYLLIPRFYFPHKYFLYGVIVLACFFITMMLPGLFFQPMHDMHPPMPEWSKFRRPPPGHRMFFNVRQHIFLFLASFFFSLLLKIRGRLQQAEEEKLETELSYLKAQVNPHFLFNTLNSIYSLAVTKSDDTATAVVKLSGMMRYMLVDAANDTVPLEKELAYIRDYISLQELRFGDDVPVQFSINGDSTGKKIAPLILISFVENAFKYGVNAEEEMYIRIDVNITGDALTMEVFNKKVKVQAPDKNAGVGIKNAENRLNLLYPARHSLTIKDNKKDFQVLLTLTLK